MREDRGRCTGSARAAMFLIRKRAAHPDAYSVTRDGASLRVDRLDCGDAIRLCVVGDATVKTVATLTTALEDAVSTGRAVVVDLAQSGELDTAAVAALVSALGLSRKLNNGSSISAVNGGRQFLELLALTRTQALFYDNQKGTGWSTTS